MIQNKNQRPDATTLYQLEQDVLQLKQSMSILHELVQEQQPEIDTIEQCINETKLLTSESKSDLEEAATYSWSSYFTYVAGILVMYMIL